VFAKRLAATNPRRLTSAPRGSVLRSRLSRIMSRRAQGRQVGPATDMAIWAKRLEANEMGRMEADTHAQRYSRQRLCHFIFSAAPLGRIALDPPSQSAVGSRPGSFQQPNLPLFHSSHLLATGPLALFASRLCRVLLRRARDPIVGASCELSRMTPTPPTLALPCDSWYRLSRL